MRNIKLTTKEIDAIKCMTEYFQGNDNGFLTRNHKRITNEELYDLQKKLGE